MTLEGYLDRINYSGSTQPCLQTLIKLHQYHLLAIPYESFDVFLEPSLDLDIERIYQKIVHRKRGGWCYEMNGLFAWALQKIGFHFIEIAGATLRSECGDESIGRHLLLAVQLEQLWLADVGFSDSIIKPVPIKVHSFSQRGFLFSLHKVDELFWRFNNHAFGCCSSFDFKVEAASRRILERSSHWLSSSKDSLFSRYPFCFRYTPNGYVALLGRRFRQVTPVACYQYWVNSFAEYQNLLGRLFGIHLASVQLRFLWDQILFNRRPESSSQQAKSSASSTCP